MFDANEDYEKWLLENPDFDDEDGYVPKTVLMTVYDSTGNGVDCDDCGYTPDVLEFTAFSDGSYEVAVSLGCYGGIFNTFHSAEAVLNALENYSEFFVQGMADVKKFLVTETSGDTGEVKG